MADNKDNVSNSFAIYVAMGKIIAMVCNFIIPIFLARYLTRENYGLYSQFLSIHGFLWSILSMGIPASLYYFYPRLEGRRRELLFSNYAIMAFLTCVGIIVINLPFVKEWVFGDSKLQDYIYIICIYLFICIPNSLVDALSVLRKDKIVAVFFHPIETILKSIFVIGFFLVFGELCYIFYGMCFYQLILSLLSLYFIFFKEKDKDMPRLSQQRIKEQLEYSLPFAFAVLLNTLCLYCDKLICISQLSEEEYAIYSMAFFSIPGIKQIYDSISQVNMVNLTKTYHDDPNNKNGLISIYNKFVVQIYSFTIPIVLIFCLFAEEIFLCLFSEKYLDSVPYFQIYIFTILFSFLGSGVILRAMGETKKIFWANFVAVVVCVPITYLMIHKIGILGAILSAVLGIVLPRLIKMVFEIKIIDCGVIKFFPIKDIFKIISVSVFCFFPIVLLKYFFELDNIFICFLLSIIYLLSVFYIEMKNNCFVVSLSFVKDKVFFLRLNKK